MIRLITLGEIDLRRSNGDPVHSVLQQPKRLALLVYLALAEATYVRRDTLLGLFWPEKREEDARHGLSQAIHYLRRSLGPAVIRGGGTEGFGIAPDALSCDARVFTETLKRGDRAEALDVYRGDFLPGFYAANAPDFEQWLESFRGQLRRQAADAAWQLAESDAATNPVNAATVARRAVELSLGDEAAVRRLLDLLHRLGDVAGMLEAYEALRTMLATEYGAEPSEETVRVMARLQAKSAAVEAASSVPDEPTAALTAAVPSPGPADRGLTRLLRDRRLRAAASGAITLALVFAFVSVWGLSRGHADGAIVPTVVVEEFRDYGRERARDDLAGAVTAEVLARLTHVAFMQVRPADTALAEERDRPPHLVLRAGLLQSADSVRVTALLLDGRSRVAVDRAFVVTPIDQSIALVDEIAGWLARFARTGAGAWLKERRWRAGDPRGRAFGLLRTALQDREQADSLRRAGAVVPALASYRMADSLLATAEAAAPGWSEPALQRAETALHLSWLHLLSAPPDLRGSRASLAAGLRHAGRAVAKSEDAAALEMRAELGYLLWRTTPADSYPAAAAALPGIERDLRRAVAADETRTRAWVMLAGLLFSRGDFGEARWAAENAHAADAFLEHTLKVAGILFSTALEAGDRPAARSWCDYLRARGPAENVGAFCELMLLATFGRDGRADVERGWAAVRALPHGVRSSPPWTYRHDLLMAVLLARAGAADSAAAMLERGAARISADPESAQLLAWGLLELGQADSAAAVLERYVSPRLHARIGVLHSERFRELRHHPRIARLLQRGERGKQRAELNRPRRIDLTR
jgi:DNA-binding SARP family transcriptional activator